MDVGLHKLISDRLDQLKGRGEVTDYLVAWRGPSGQLSPNVTIWHRDAASEKLQMQIRWLIGDLVSESEIQVLYE